MNGSARWMLAACAASAMASCSGGEAPPEPVGRRVSPITKSVVWQERTPKAKPPARHGHAMAFDAAHGTTVLFGGRAGAALGDTWLWDGATWAESPASGPPPRYDAALAFDSARGRVVLFGGSASDASGADLSDTWEWDGTAWKSVGPASGPAARHACALAFDEQRGVTVLFGGLQGQVGPKLLGDTWEWNGSDWTEQHPTSPPVLAGPMVFDTTLAASLELSPSIGMQPYLWDGSSWTPLFPSSSPSLRTGSAFAFDSVRAKGVLFGGNSGTAQLAETWEWDGQAVAFVQTATQGPPGRDSHAMAYDRARGTTVLFGGLGGTTDLDDTWVYWERGTSCTSDTDCDTALCAGGVCCDRACDTCQACDTPLSPGVCAPVSGDHDTCTGTHTCDPTGACKLHDGQSCTAGSDCATGSCRVGVCCDPACPSRCSASGTCLATASCSDDHTAVSGSESTSCSPYACKAAKGCLLACASVDDCASGFVCSAGQCAAAPPEGAADGGSSGGCAVARRPGPRSALATALAAMFAAGVARIGRRASRRRGAASARARERRECGS